MDATQVKTWTAHFREYGFVVLDKGVEDNLREQLSAQISGVAEVLRASTAGCFNVPVAEADLQSSGMLWPNDRGESNMGNPKASPCCPKTTAFEKGFLDATALELIASLQKHVRQLFSTDDFVASTVALCDNKRHEPPPPPHAEWVCPACTLVNKDRSFICQACETERVPAPGAKSAGKKRKKGKKGKSSKSSSSNSVETGKSSKSSAVHLCESKSPPPLLSAEWHCHMCTYLNKPRLATCDMCHTVRQPVDEAPNALRRAAITTSRENENSLTTSRKRKNSTIIAEEKTGESSNSVETELLMHVDRCCRGTHDVGLTSTRLGPESQDRRNIVEMHPSLQAMVVVDISPTDAPKFKIIPSSFKSFYRINNSEECPVGTFGTQCTTIAQRPGFYMARGGVTLELTKGNVVLWDDRTLHGRQPGKANGHRQACMLTFSAIPTTLNNEGRWSVCCV